MRVQRRTPDHSSQDKDPEKDEALFGDFLANMLWAAWSPFEDREEGVAYWRAHRERLLAEYRKRCPGKRPWIWWQEEAPGQRRITDPEGLLEWERERRGEAYGRWVLRVYDDWSGELSHGVPYGRDEPYTNHMAPDYRFIETEAEFLDRHDLLTDAERAALEEETTT